MLPLAVVVLLVMSVGFWLFSPLLGFLTPLLSLSWLGWALLAVAVWLFAGTGTEEPPSRPPDGSGD